MSFNGDDYFDFIHSAPENSVYWTGLPNQPSTNDMPAAGFSPVQCQRQVNYSAPANSTGNVPAMGDGGYLANNNNYLHGNGMPMADFNASGNSTGTMYPPGTPQMPRDSLNGHQMLPNGYNAYGSTANNAYLAPRRNRQQQPSQSTVYNHYGDMNISQGYGGQRFVFGVNGMPMGTHMQAHWQMYQAPPAQYSQWFMGQENIHNGVGIPMGTPFKPQRASYQGQAQQDDSQWSMGHQGVHNGVGMDMGGPVQPQTSMHPAQAQHNVSQWPMNQASIQDGAVMPMGTPIQPQRSAQQPHVHNDGSLLFMVSAAIEKNRTMATGTPQIGAAQPAVYHAVPQGPMHPVSGTDAPGMGTAPLATSRRERVRQALKTGQEVIALDDEIAVPASDASFSSSGTMPPAKEMLKKAFEPEDNAWPSRKRKTDDNDASPRQTSKRSKKRAAVCPSKSPTAIPVTILTSPQDIRPVDNVSARCEQVLRNAGYGQSISLDGAPIAITVPDTNGSTTSHFAPPTSENAAPAAESLIGASPANAVPGTTGATTDQLRPPSENVAPAAESLTSTPVTEAVLDATGTTTDQSTPPCNEAEIMKPVQDPSNALIGVHAGKTVGSATGTTTGHPTRPTKSVAFESIPGCKLCPKRKSICPDCVVGGYRYRVRVKKEKEEAAALAVSHRECAGKRDEEAAAAALDLELFGEEI